jgi:apolipoprotein N-acyltransferase
MRVKRRFVHAAIAILCGCLLVLSCASFDIWPLAWIAWAPVIWIVLDDQSENAWAYGFLCGLVANAGGFYWFIGFLERFAHLPFIAALPIFLVLISYQAIGWALFCYFLRGLHKTAGLPVTFLAPILFAAIEFAMPNLFVWYFAITQAWVTPVIQIAEMTGPLGVSFLLILCNALLYEAAHALRTRAPFPLRRVLAGGGVLAACIGFGFVRIQQVQAARNAAPTFMVGVVQANVGVHQKRQLEDAQRQLFTHQKVSAVLAQAGADLILWPETSYPYGFGRDLPRDRLPGDPRRVHDGFQTPIIFGTLTMDGDSRFPYNSAILIDKNSEVRGRFDKNRLIIFGEYLPYYQQLQFIKRWVPDVDNFARGTDVTKFPLELATGTVQIAPMISNEDILPAFGRRLARLRPNLLVDLTNDAWFGNTSEPWEHLALSVYRAVEMRLDLVRAVNTGVSAFIDSTGRVYAKTRVVDPDDASNAEPDSLLERVAVQQTQTLYATVGEWFGWSCLVTSILLFLRSRIARRTTVG